MMQIKDKYKTVIDHLNLAALHPPKEFTLSITNGCNLHCLHCWPDSCSHERAQHMSVEIIKRLIFEFAQLGGEIIIITGGEPLIHPAWQEITAFACEAKGIKSVCLQTNATLFTESIVKSLESDTFKKLSIQVSIEGATAQKHDYVRGPGSFQYTMRGLNILAASRLREKIDIAFTEMKHNFKDIPKLLELAKALRIHRFISSTLVQSKRALTAHLAPPTSLQYKHILQYYHTDERFREHYEGMGNIAAIEWYKGRNDTSRQGCVFIENLYVTTDGRLYPCVMFQADKYAAKGVHERPLDEILLEMIPYWAGLQEISRNRIFGLKNCNQCLGFLHCAGGCFGRAYLAHQDTMSVEDRCSLRKAVYMWRE